MVRPRHVRRVGSQLVGYAVVHRQWWMLLVAALLALTVAFVSAGHAAAPYTLYTLF